MEYDFVDQLQRHTISGFGQHARHGGLLAEPMVRAALRDTIQWCRRALQRSGYDDAQLDAVPLTWGPRVIRRFFSIPRCTDRCSHGPRTAAPIR